MCVQLADSTIRYPEGVVERLIVKAKNTFILADFVVLDMEGDLGIPLMLGRPFLKDTNARIDVETGRISLRIMGKTMKFKFQNKREVFLIHEDSEKQGLWAEPGWNDQDYHSPSKSTLEDWEIHTSPIEPMEDDQKISDFITNTVWKDLEIIYPTSDDPVTAPSTLSKKTKKKWRKKNKTSSTATTSPGMDETTST
jgi:hypothetical protein